MNWPRWRGYASRLNKRMAFIVHIFHLVFICILSYRHWYYEDFIREENSKFPSLPLKKFSEMFFQACPLLERWRGDHDGAFNHFMQYKTRVPVCGAIMLNDTWDKVNIHFALW